MTKLLRVTAFVQRFINRLKGNHIEHNYLTSGELEEAERMWIRFVQRKNFNETFQAISYETKDNLQKQLGLYVDNQGLLRCKGMLDNSQLTEGARRPILLPNNERFTHLKIEKTHKQNFHAGVSQTLSQMRYHFWIPHGRATVRKVIHQCVICRRHDGGPYRMPPMPSLPPSRVTEATPFSKTGLDYMGPLYIKIADGSKKVWICLFTCLVTRAIHLELVQDMTSDEFLLCFRRFISQRGCPTEITSDNAMYFKATSQTLNSALRRMTKCEEVQNYASTVGLKWIFIVELAPWMGGFYERLVGLVKRALRKTLGRKLLSLIQMQTVIKEVEAVLNSRPLVYVGDDVNSSITLTPGHFLSLNQKTGIPELDADNSDEDYNPDKSTASKLLQIWKKGQKLLSMFWKNWYDGYLLSLRERTQSQLKCGRIQSAAVPEVGYVVLVKEDMPRGCRKLGKVIHLVVSRDGHTRSAKVRLSSGRVIGRP
ncbi:MAG: hypothetical protein N0C80_17530, partial [Candidatus Thiodiazotropha endolucinida]|nr:hypothetical protein [Candidatus Thiodiazotropha taylori]MCW4272707.1 hypothetical protein [Candidatus Thiodiazotropha endolucinida]